MPHVKDTRQHGARLMHVMLNVADIGRTLVFYAALGLRVQVDRSDAESGRRNLFLGFGSEADTTLIEIASPSDPARPDFGHIAIEVPDLIGLVDRLPMQGIAIERALRCLPSGAMTAFVCDPDGHRIELVQQAGCGIARKGIAWDGLEFAMLEMDMPQEAGLPLLMLHGGASRADHFTDLMVLLAAHHRCLAYDQRGFAQTGARLDTPIDHAHWADDVRGLLDRMEIERVVLLGWSLGTSVAINAARQWPDRVAALVLMGVPDPHRRVDVARLRERQLELKSLSPEAATERDREQIRAMLGEPGRQDATIMARLLAERAATSPALAARAVEAYATRGDLAEMAPGIACPVHLIAGDQDQICPPAGAQVLRGLLAEDMRGAATMDIIPDCGHYYALEQAEAVAVVLRARLQRG